MSRFDFEGHPLLFSRFLFPGLTLWELSEMTDSINFLVWLAWKGERELWGGEMCTGVWRLGFRASLPFTSSVTLNKAVTIHKNKNKRTHLPSCLWIPLSPASSWIVVTAQQMLIEHLNESVCPRELLQEDYPRKRVLCNVVGQVSLSWSLALSLCMHQCLRRV